MVLKSLKIKKKKKEKKEEDIDDQEVKPDSPLTGRKKAQENEMR